MDNQEINELPETSPLRDQINEIEIGNKFLKLFRKIEFQSLMIMSIYRLIVYINKLYQDVNTIQQFYKDQDFYFLMISVIGLFLPPFVYVIYLIGRSCDFFLFFFNFL